MSPRDPRIDAYIAQAPDFARPLLERLREAVHEACPEVVETTKWSSPFFTYRGAILCHMAAFKQHVAFGFWKGSLIDTGNPEKRGEAMGQFGRLTRLADLPARRALRGYIEQAMALHDAGVKPPRAKPARPKPPLEVPPDLGAALARNKKANKTFAAFAPSHRREYLEWIAEAKRPETRAKRIAQAIEWLAEGKPRNWKYLER
jgi:uncharacterized protein YdeI (YjbR/CyaY-like superfamily)